MAKNDLFETPPDLAKVLDDEFHFTLEACADKDRRAYPTIPYLGLDNGYDALGNDWGSSTFCNPPYSKGNVAKFCEKGFYERRHGTQVLLIPADVGTVNWYRLSTMATEIRFLRGRVTFWLDGKPAKDTARFSSAIVVFTSSPKPCQTWWWDWRASLAS